MVVGEELVVVVVEGSSGAGVVCRSRGHCSQVGSGVGGYVVGGLVGEVEQPSV